MFCKNVAPLVVTRGCHTWIHSLATAKQAIFLQNILWESYSKFNFKQCSFKKFFKILIFWREYMEMCFHGNHISWGINHSFISLYSKYQPLSFICSSIMLAPVISSLDEIYCMPYRRACLNSGCALLKLHCICKKYKKNHKNKMLKYFKFVYI